MWIHGNCWWRRWCGGDSGWKQRGFAFVFFVQKNLHKFSICYSFFLVNNRKWSRFPRELRVFFTPERKFCKRNLFFVQTVQLAQFFLHKNYFWIVSFLHTFYLLNVRKNCTQIFQVTSLYKFFFAKLTKNFTLFAYGWWKRCNFSIFFQEKIDREKKRKIYVKKSFCLPDTWSSWWTPIGVDVS